MDELLDLIKKKVNRLGELNLDEHQTNLLIRWMSSVNDTLIQQNKLVDQLQKLVKEGA